MANTNTTNTTNGKQASSTASKGKTSNNTKKLLQSKASNAKPKKDIVTEVKQESNFAFDIEPQPKAWKDRHSPTIGNNGFDLQPGDNSKAVQDMLYIYQMPKIDINDDQAVEERIQEYFQYCIARDIRPGVEGMAMALGVNRRTLWDWEQGNSRNNSVVRSDIIRKSKQFLALYMENLSQTGKINPVTAIFLMKNHFNYRDQQDLVVTPNNALQPTMSMEEIAEKVKSDVVIDADYE